MMLAVAAALVSAAATAPEAHAADGPCDIFSTGGTPCVAAHSVVRALFGAYSGPLYQIVRTTDGKSLNITTLSAGGYADGAAQAAFCDGKHGSLAPSPPARWAPGPCCAKRLTCGDFANRSHPTAPASCVGCAECPAPKKQPMLATCMITRIFDQSPYGNHLSVIGEPSGLIAVGAGGRLHNGSPITGTNASADPLFVGGHAVYSAYFEGGMGFRNNETKGVATGDEPETIYMVTAGDHYNGGCCFDYGNAEVGLYPNTSNHFSGSWCADCPKGMMECVNFGNGYGAQGGPHVLADLEMGVFGNKTPAAAANASFVTAMLKGDSGNHWAIKWGDAQGGPLVKVFDGPRPSKAYSPMKKPGAIILGLGGDTSPGGIGTFYEGVLTKGYSTDAADDAVQANIVAAGFGKQY